MLKDKKWLITLIVPIIGVLIAGLIHADIKPTGQISGNTINAEGDVNIAGRDVNIKKIIQGIDERDLALYLGKLTSTNKQKRLRQVKKWYDKKEINSNLKEALNIVIERIDVELKTTRETIQKLRAEGKDDLAKLLERLNKAFEKGPDNLEKEESDVLKQIEKEAVAQKIEVFINTAERFNTALEYRKAVKRYERVV